MVYRSLTTYRLWTFILRCVFDNFKLYNVQERRVHLTEARFRTERSLYFVNVLRLTCTLYNQVCRCFKTTGSDHSVCTIYSPLTNICIYIRGEWEHFGIWGGTSLCWDISNTGNGPSLILEENFSTKYIILYIYIFFFILTCNATEIFLLKGRKGGDNEAEGGYNNKKAGYNSNTLKRYNTDK